MTVNIDVYRVQTERNKAKNRRDRWCKVLGTLSKEKKRGRLTDKERMTDKEKEREREREREK